MVSKTRKGRDVMYNGGESKIVLIKSKKRQACRGSILKRFF
jgi:hypothetical protein